MGVRPGGKPAERRHPVEVARLFPLRKARAGVIPDLRHVHRLRERRQGERLHPTRGLGPAQEPRTTTILLSTDFTPSTLAARRAARVFSSFDGTVPKSETTPLAAVTSMPAA